jgi:large subunit ribosomal protein L10
MAKFMKTMMAEEVRADLEESANLLVVGLLPMTAEADLDLRNKLRGLGARLRVIHNRTSRFALDDARKGLAEHFKGQTALTLVPGEEPDMVNVAKTVVAAAKEKRVEVRGGFVEGELLDKQGVELLSRSPDKHTLRGMLAGTILGSARGIAVCLQSVGGGIARCLQARIDKEEGGDA